MSKKLGTLIKDARNTKGLSQAALAAMVEGLSATELGKIERGEKEPAEAMVRQIAKALGVTQVSLVSAMSGSASKTSSAAKKTSTTSTAAKKTSTSTAKKTSSSAAKKTSTSSTAKKTTSKTSAELKLTATEKKLVEAYRKADSTTKKTALNILEGNGSVSDILTTMLAGKASSSSKDAMGNILESALNSLGKLGK